MNYIFEGRYKDTKINRLIFLTLRTKNKRIRAKLFKRLLPLCTAERGVVRFGDLVVMRPDVWECLKPHYEIYKSAKEDEGIDVIQ
jgi:hypothetical protein